LVTILAALYICPRLGISIQVNIITKVWPIPSQSRQQALHLPAATRKFSIDLPYLRWSLFWPKWNCLFDHRAAIWKKPSMRGKRLKHIA
jgi:hypothetical protein